jgi:tetratricopeptide (TPR) repeat protein
LLGRHVEVRKLKDAWRSGRVRVLCFVGDSGVGKSAIAKAGLREIAEEEEGFHDRCFAWSAYNDVGDVADHATVDPLDDFHAALADLFIQDAAEAFKVRDRFKADGDEWQKGEILAEGILERGGVLLLDGFERHQTYPGADDGIQHRGLIALLRTMASSRDRSVRSLCVVTSQVPLEQLQLDFPNSVKNILVEPLQEEAGGQILKGGDVRGSDGDLAEVAGFFGGHPLTLRVLAGYLKFRKKPGIEAASEIPGRDLTGVLTAFERALAETPGRETDRELLRLIGLYDCPAERESLASLIDGTTIPGLSEALSHASPQEREGVVDRLVSHSLLEPIRRGARSALDAHQLVRAYGAELLLEENPSAWKKGHRRLGEYLAALAEQVEDPIRRIAYLYAAMAHYIRAEEYDRSFEIYEAKIQEGPKRTALRQFGVVAPAALEPFFHFTRERVLWDRPVRGLSPVNRALVTGAAADDLWHGGRLRESLDASDAGARTNFRLWGTERSRRRRGEALRRQAENARRAAETAWSLGELGTAEGYARRSTLIAQSCDRAGEKGSPDAEQVGMSAATLARVLHLQGRLDEALEAFGQAAARNGGGELPFLFGLWHADLLLELGRLDEARLTTERVQVALETHKVELDLAYSHLILALIALRVGHLDDARKRFIDALRHVRNSHQVPHLPPFLIACADFHISEAVLAPRGDSAPVDGPLGMACKLLGEAREIIRPEQRDEREYPDRLALYLGDYHLVSSRLCLVRGAFHEAAVHHGLAAEAIASCGYGRRQRRAERLRTAIASLRPIVDGTPGLCRDFGVDPDHSLTALEAIYDRLVDPKEEKDLSGQVPDAADVPELGAVSFNARPADHDPQRLHPLEERLEELVRPLVAGLPLLIEEFGLGTGDWESALRSVWAIVEQNVRVALEQSTSSGLSPRTPDSTTKDDSSSIDFRTLRVLRTAEAAALIDVKPETLTRRAMRGRIGELKDGHYVFSERELREYQSHIPKGGRPRKSTSSPPAPGPEDE